MGVLYTYDGAIDGAVAFVEYLNASGKIFYVVTNNTSSDIEGIAARFQKLGFQIREDQILSSGLGLQYDTSIRRLLEGKKTYVSGWDRSGYYAQRAGAVLCDEIASAEAVVLAASQKQNTEEELDRLISFARHADVPIICCNPDRFVRTNEGLHPVIGYYAAILEKTLGREIIWVGKPCDNFSVVVKNYVTDQHPTLEMGRCLFIDDNFENCIAMQQHIGVKSCCVYETGLTEVSGIEELSQKYGKSPSFFVPSLAF